MNMIKKLLLLTLILPGIVKPNYKPTYNWPSAPVQKEVSFSFRMPKINWPSLNIDRIKEFLKPEILVGAAVCLGGIAAIYGLYKYFKKPDAPSQKPEMSASIIYNTYGNPGLSAIGQTPNTNPLKSLNPYHANTINNPSEYIEIKQTTVLEQKEAATCGYHAIKNALAVIKKDQDLLTNQQKFNKFFDDNKFIAIEIRKINATAKYLFDLFLNLMKPLSDSDNKNELFKALFTYYRSFFYGLARSYAKKAISRGEYEINDIGLNLKNIIKEAVIPQHLAELLLTADDDIITNYINDGYSIQEILISDTIFDYFFKPEINKCFTINIQELFEHEYASKNGVNGEWLEGDEIRTIIEANDSELLNHVSILDSIDALKNLNNKEDGINYKELIEFEKLWKENQNCFHIFLFNTHAQETTNRLGHWYAIITTIENHSKSIEIVDSKNADRREFEEIKDIIKFLES